MKPPEKNSDAQKMAELRLKTQYAITRALADSTTLAEAAPRVLAAVCEHLGWQVGGFWYLDTEAGHLRCVETWHAEGVDVSEFEEVSRQQRFTSGVGLPGRVWETRKPTWVVDMTNSSFTRAALAERADLHGAFAFPILLAGEVLGVMEFFSRDEREPDKTVIEMMETVGSQMGQFIERKRVQTEQEERARLTALGADVGIALTQTDDLREMLGRCAQTLVKHLDAAFARIWTLNEAENVLELEASAGMYTHLDGAHARVPVGKFKIGLIAEERKAHLTNSVVGDPRVGDQEWAEREGMVSFAGYPLIVAGKLVGVMAMFSRHAQTPRALEAMESVANGIALGITRKRAERELQASEQRYRSLSEAMPQIVWATDANGSHFYYNQRWYEYTGLTEEESLGFGFAHALHPEDRERTLKRWQSAWRDGESYEIEYRFYSRPRQEYRWFLGRAVPVKNASGQIVQWVGTCTDIEEQKLVEATLARLNEERAAMIEEVSTPVVPVWRGVLALPLIGSLDTERMQRATQAALNEVMRKGARACIIDITGARIVDTQAVANLSNLVAALKLIGAEAIVTGITAQAARSLVSLGVDFSNMRTHRTLAEALATLINEREIKRGGIAINGTGKDIR
jgi:PAS domain S-box-containing protein